MMKASCQPRLGGDDHDQHCAASIAAVRYPKAVAAAASARSLGGNGIHPIGIDDDVLRGRQEGHQNGERRQARGVLFVGEQNPIAAMQIASSA